MTFQKKTLFLLHWKISQLILALKRNTISIFQGSLLNKYPWKRNRTKGTSALFASCAEMQGKPLENSLSQQVPQSFTVTLPPISIAITEFPFPGSKLDFLLVTFSAFDTFLLVQSLLAGLQSDVYNFSTLLSQH